MSKQKRQANPEEKTVKHEWTFLSNHTHVLICLYRNPTERIRDLSAKVGITERAIIGIIEDLEQIGVIHKLKEGRRNKYEINESIYLRHPLEEHKTVGNLLKLLK
ncbi:MAG: MarR family transcriptional regulator [Leptospiraceae bacterium]|nr:MarR family transcriptional regulator [Leptospiraceae bacterium]MCP5501138.1 MarR family transcriptional regulator [Leptospiraceae bacterium]